MVSKEGWMVLALIFFCVVFGLILGVYCHFCAEMESGGHYYGSHENVNTIIFLPTAKGTGGGKDPGKNRTKCRCSNKFKGSCKYCKGEDFVDDGSDGEHPDFSDFGGHKGLDPEWGNKPDPIRSILGGNSSQNQNHHDQGSNHNQDRSYGDAGGGGGGGGDSFSGGMGMSDG